MSIEFDDGVIVGVFKRQRQHLLVENHLYAVVRQHVDVVDVGGDDVDAVDGVARSRRAASVVAARTPVGGLQTW